MSRIAEWLRRRKPAATPRKAPQPPLASASRVATGPKGQRWHIEIRAFDPGPTQQDARNLLDLATTIIEF